MSFNRSKTHFAWLCAVGLHRWKLIRFRAYGGQPDSDSWGYRCERCGEYKGNSAK